MDEAGTAASTPSFLEINEEKKNYDDELNVRIWAVEYYFSIASMFKCFVDGIMGNKEVFQITFSSFVVSYTVWYLFIS